MKKIITCLIAIVISLCNSKCQQSLNKDVVELLKADKFNQEIYELAFCANEILYVIEHDSSYSKVLEKRFTRSIDNTNKPEITYIRSLELDLFRDMLKPLQSEFPAAYRIVWRIIPSIRIDQPAGFSKIFNTYIEYPEQADDICLIMLTCKISCKAFDDIQKDKVSEWKYNNWLEYGFEEFRYAYGKTSKAKTTINNRIIDYVLKREDCKDKVLVVKAKELLRSKTL